MTSHNPAPTQISGAGRAVEEGAYFGGGAAGFASATLALL
jgi:hypothetical protein